MQPMMMETRLDLLRDLLRPKRHLSPCQLIYQSTSHMTMEWSHLTLVLVLPTPKSGVKSSSLTTASPVDQQFDRIKTWAKMVLDGSANCMSRSFSYDCNNLYDLVEAFLFEVLPPQEYAELLGDSVVGPSTGAKRITGQVLRAMEGICASEEYNLRRHCIPTNVLMNLCIIYTTFNESVHHDIEFY